MARRETSSQKGALDMMEGVNVSGIGPQEAAKLETLFKLLSNGEEEIGLPELADLMPRLGCFHSEDELKTLFESVDIDGSGLINFIEFLQFMAQYRESSQLALLEGGAECFRHLVAASKMQRVLRADDVGNWVGDTLVLIAISFYIIVVLYEDARGVDLGVTAGYLKLVFAVVMLLDIVRGMFTSLALKDTQSLPVDDRPQVRARYLKSLRFAIDAVAAIPLDVTFWAVGMPYWMRIAQNIRLVKFFAFPFLFQLTPRDILTPTYARFYFVIVPMLKLAFWAVIATHCLAVVWMMLIDEGVRTDANEWAYLDAIYFVVYTLTTTGYGDILVVTDAQKIFAIFLFCCATLVTGVVVGKIVQVSQQADLKSDARTRMLETLAALNHLTIPNDFKEEVLAFQLHRLKHSNSLFNDAISGLPQCMQDRMALYARMKIVRQVPIFAEVTEVCVAKLAQSLVNVFAPPEEYIVIAGEEGEEMFFLFHGMCCVALPDGRVVATIKRGGVFGEVALLQQTRRAASIKSLTYCQLFRLDKVDFGAITQQFPKVFESIVAQSVTLSVIKKNSTTGLPASADAAEKGELPVIQIYGSPATTTPSPLITPQRSDGDADGVEGALQGADPAVEPDAQVSGSLLGCDTKFENLITRLGHIEAFLENVCKQKNIEITPVPEGAAGVPSTFPGRRRSSAFRSRQESPALSGRRRRSSVALSVGSCGDAPNGRQRLGGSRDMLRRTSSPRFPSVGGNGSASPTHSAGHGPRELMRPRRGSASRHSSGDPPPRKGRLSVASFVTATTGSDASDTASRIPPPLVPSPRICRNPEGNAQPPALVSSPR